MTANSTPAIPERLQNASTEALLASLRLFVEKHWNIDVISSDPKVDLRPMSAAIQQVIEDKIVPLLIATKNPDHRDVPAFSDEELKAITDHVAQTPTSLLKNCLDASSDFINASDLSSLDTGDHTAAQRSFIDQIQNSPIAAFEAFRKGIRPLTENSVISALASFAKTLGPNAPSADDPATSGGLEAAPPYVHVGHVNYDSQTGRVADTVVQTATAGKFDSLGALVEKLADAERAIIEARRNGSTATTDAITDAETGIARRVLASEVFSDALTNPAEAQELGFEVTVYDWPMGQGRIPAVNHRYAFEVKSLKLALYGLEHGLNTTLIGPTGCGKTTLAEQLAARLNRPFFRVPIDGEMRQRAMFGGIRQIATEKGSAMVWADGVLPQAMALPSIVCLDEMDRMDPDLAYLLHQVLEGKGITLLEDENRTVSPHKDFRIFGSANTKGVADSFNRYNMVSELSEATRDRFPLWIDMGYLPKEREVTLLMQDVPGSKKIEINKLVDLGGSMRQSFTSGKIRTACSYRQMFHTAKLAYTMRSMPFAIKAVMIGRAATPEDAASITEKAVQLFGQEMLDALK